jgi:hypothetical protein
VLCFDPITCYLNQDNKGTNIGYNINYMNVLRGVCVCIVDSSSNSVALGRRWQHQP